MAPIPAYLHEHSGMWLRRRRGRWARRGRRAGRRWRRGLALCACQTFARQWAQSQRTIGARRFNRTQIPGERVLDSVGRLWRCIRLLETDCSINFVIFLWLLLRLLLFYISVHYVPFRLYIYCFKFITPINLLLPRNNIHPIKIIINPIKIGYKEIDSWL